MGHLSDDCEFWLKSIGSIDYQVTSATCKLLATGVAVDAKYSCTLQFNVYFNEVNSEIPDRHQQL